jgi:glycopeptide antibiotics resistance protein
MRTPPAQLDVTIDHQPDPGDANPVAPRPALTFVAEAASRSTTELEQLLRKRLLFFGLLIVTIMGLILLVFLPLSLVQLLTRGSEAPSDFWITQLMSGLQLLLFGVLTVRLWRRRDLSLRTLRAIEITLFGSTALYMAVARLLNNLSRLGYAHVRELMEAGADDLANQYLGGMVSTAILGSVLIIMLYGILIPNTSRRCAVVVGVLALIPFTAQAVVMLAYRFPPLLCVSTSLWVGFHPGQRCRGRDLRFAPHRGAARAGGRGPTVGPVPVARPPRCRGDGGSLPG